MEEVEKRLDEIRVRDAEFYPLMFYFKSGANIAECRQKIRRWDDSIQLHELQGEDDLQILAEYRNEHQGGLKDLTEEIKKTVKIKQYPQIVCSGSDVGWGREITTLEKEISRVKDYFKKMGYKAEIKVEKMEG